MKEIYTKMRKAAMTRIWLGIAFILLGGVFFLGMGEEFKYLTAKENLFDMDTVDMHATSAGSDSVEAFYTFEGNLLLDWYASDDEGYYYIFPTADGAYMGLYVYNSEKATADKICEETLKYMNKETDQPPATYLKGKGYVYNMGSDEESYFKEYFTEAGAGASVISTLVYKTFVVTPLSKLFDITDIIIVLMLIFFLAFGLIYMAGFFTGAYKKQPIKYMREYGLSESEVGSDLTYGLHKKHIDIGKKYVMLYSTTCALLSYDQLLWTYVMITTTKHRTYGIPTGTTRTYQVFFVMRNQKTFNISVKDEPEGQDIVAAISEMAPHVICGYHEDLSEMVKKNFAQLIKIVDDHKLELEQQSEEVAVSEEESPSEQEPAQSSDSSFRLSEGDIDKSSDINYGEQEYSSMSQSGSGLDEATFGTSSTGFKLK